MTNKKIKICQVVACSENGIIGANNKMPWHLPDELQNFKNLTMGKVLLMGRKTFDSINRALPGRYSIVISRSKEMLPRIVTPATSLEAGLELAREAAPQWGGEICIIGGGEIYRQTLDLVDTIYLTKIQRHIEGDTTYPLEALKEFTCVSREEVTTGELPYAVTKWERKR